MHASFGYEFKAFIFTRFLRVDFDHPITVTLFFQLGRVKTQYRVIKFPYLKERSIQVYLYAAGSKMLPSTCKAWSLLEVESHIIF